MEARVGGRLEGKGFIFYAALHRCLSFLMTSKSGKTTESRKATEITDMMRV